MYAFFGIPSSPLCAAAEETERILNNQHAADRFFSAGSPISTEEYLAVCIDDCGDQALALISLLHDLPPPLSS
jgi:hypothetical protein